MIDYPASLPCPSKGEGFSVGDAAGVVRSPLEAGNSRQRRMHRLLPEQLSLVWTIDQPKTLAAWLAWANVYGWDWFMLTLPGLAASRAGARTAPMPVRFVSDVQQEFMGGAGLWVWRVRVEAEAMPSSADLALG
ncbi:MAG: hypothetical protein ACJ72W_01480 [Actinoallomurus sp.]